MRRAFSLLRSGRPGPVVLAVPNATATFDEEADPYFAPKGYKAGPNPEDVNTAVDLRLNAKNPLIYAGEGVIYAGASAELRELAEMANAPVITTLKAKGAFPENHPLFVGVRGDHPAEFLEKSDVILAVGSSLSPGRFTHGIPNAASKTIIQCNLDEFHINRIYPTHHAVLGDARFTLRALADGVAERTGGSGRDDDGVAAAVKASRGRRAGAVPGCDGVGRSADQSVPGVRRHDEGAGPDEVVCDARLGEHAGPVEHGV